ncbi:MAG: hypothetical protein ACQESG_06785 [Nanobdellota archaeon]
MNILVIGDRRPMVHPLALLANELGRAIALRGHTLIASPSAGIQGMTARAYKAYGGREFIGYYPHPDIMFEEVIVKPDVGVHTREDYPMRNLMQVMQSSR